jgi:hypothetical protein
MPRRRPGLPSGYNLTERLEEGTSEIYKREEKRKEQLLGTRIVGGAALDEEGKPLVDDNKPVQDIDTSLFNTVTVAQIANKPDNPANYGQGPAGSTRLCSHKFIIDQPMFDLYGAKIGYILVRFHKNGRRGPDWVYGPVDVAIYQQFAASNSKGHFINTTLNGYGYRPANETSFADQFYDFPANSGTDAAGIRL